MHILAIETTGPYCSVAVINENAEAAEITSEKTLSHLQSLTVMIGDVLKDTGIELKDLDAIAVSEGPGSFTGVRIGVSTARGISQVLGTKLISVPTLEAFGTYESSLIGDKETLVCPVFDARRHQVYADGCLGEEETVRGGPYMIDEFLGLLGEYDRISFVGDGVRTYGDIIREWADAGGKTIEMDERTQHAEGVAQLGLRLFRRGEFKEYNELVPNYMRKAEAERKLDAKKAAAAAQAEAEK
ncbi:MAG: tRNA (adenosine(37)-N6)-threonylcarbamoyltransferase complex dimerization subunit type 1 TsaB [Eubacteriaceae bacterium]|jgi:tRNA threonylcarbamoyladenosine biosynthesis protein TsaB|nr:tRNA (adenosine(37)-N6)-threonylcarbamoyltransferase complex dimerization subunit type 1 TsaB [Eubacteriaceae bacterium]